MTNKWTQEYYIEAYSFAERAHRSYNQTITGTDVPYITHPGFVCMEVMAALRETPDVYNENLAIQCAFLHDTIEDTNITYEILAEKFGIEVADGVLALTKDSMLPHGEQMADSLKRIKQQPIEVQMVKLADRISNLRPSPSSLE